MTMTVNTIPSAKTTNANRAVRSGRVLRWLPTVFFIIAAVLMVVSISYPYWGLVLQAPQYPGGLQLRVFVNYMTGDEDPRLDEVAEIDGLNHYIGMKSLYEAARLERSIAIPAVILMVALLAVAAFWRKRWTWLLTLPAMLFPFIFLADLWLWMSYYGQNLDPYAPLSSSIQPFTPPVLGEGVIGQFKTVASVDTGWMILVVGSLLILLGVLIRLVSRMTKTKG